MREFSFAICNELCDLEIKTTVQRQSRDTALGNSTLYMWDYNLARAGSEAIISLEIENLGTAPDTIGLEIENLIGRDVKVDPSSISLEIGETGKATVRVRVPENTLIGQTNTITIHAVSSGDPTVSANSSISIEVVTPFWDIPDVRFLVGLFIGVLVGTTLISTVILRRAQINRKENRRS